MPRTNLRASLDLPYDDALAKIPQFLKDVGFGVLTRIDVDETLRARLGVPFRRYTIFGACNPVLAHRALIADPDVGILLPCNLAVYEDDDGRTIVVIMDPLEALADDEEAALREVAAEARTKLNHFLYCLAKVSRRAA
ncbi:DUF302 domain-containing protein [Polyangium sorediatum]|uniref:DUF302 domain-containing protein n=1 Tax=Polyangium sorediatum TaxID=889274 RepID=A0ABT6P4E6_9BACT|nr:DUF302 domain-containing protein [Polyangium sorediatum]MDI1435469.1 DUF302 domain-containing protein [Polyangium sorediatum]